MIVGVPSNDFGGQEPGTAGEIASFCKRNYGVTFPLAGKLAVKGEGANPLYTWAGEMAGQLAGPSGISTSICSGAMGNSSGGFQPRPSPWGRRLRTR